MGALEGIFGEASDTSLIFLLLVCLLTAVLVIAAMAKRRHARKKRTHRLTEDEIFAMAKTDPKLQARVNLYEYKLMGNSIYEKRDRLLTNRELDFYRILRPICESRGLHVFSKMRLADVVLVPDRLRRECGNAAFGVAFGKVSQKHVDFIVCDDETRVVCLIEVDDASHDHPAAQKRDAVKRGAIATAGYTLLSVRGRFSFETVDEMIDSALEDFRKQAV